MLTFRMGLLNFIWKKKHLSQENLEKNFKIVMKGDFSIKY